MGVHVAVVVAVVNVAVDNRVGNDSLVGGEDSASSRPTRSNDDDHS